MKVKDILILLPKHQETQIHFKDYGYYASHACGLLNFCTKTLDANVTKIETDYINDCKCTVVKIYTDLELGD